MITMRLQEIAAIIGARVTGRLDGHAIRRVSTDSRDTVDGDLFFAIRGPRFDGHTYVSRALEQGATACVVDDGQASTENGMCLVVEDTVAALGKLAHHYRKAVISRKTCVVAITGSNGKTTTKRMVDHVLGRSLVGRASPKSFNNQIGVPLTLLSAEANDDYLIVEVGTNAPGEVAFLAGMASPDVGVVTSVGEAHLQGLGSLSSVAKEKGSILSHIRHAGLAVVNIDRAEILPFINPPAGVRLVTCGLDPKARLCVTDIDASIRRSVFELDGRFKVEVPMPGGHHAANAAATFAVARWFGLDPAEIIDRLKSFSPPDGRTNLLDVGGATVIDDSYNANPTSMAGALSALQSATARRRVFVAGDMLELGGEALSYHRKWLERAIRGPIDQLYLVGPVMRQAADELQGLVSRERVVICDDADSAAAKVGDSLVDGDVVWVKGSRAMELDRVVDRLRALEFGRTAVA